MVIFCPIPGHQYEACLLFEQQRAGFFFYELVTKDATQIVETGDTKGKFTVVESVSLGNELC